MEDIIWNFIKYLIFPGVLFAVFFGFFVQWLDRKFYARGQQRVGPPLTQPIWDFVKLLAKRDDPPDGASVEFQLIPPLMVLLALFTAVLIPVYGFGSSAIAFHGDLFFILFLLALHGALVFLLGWSAKSPYSITGGSRAVLTEMSAELPFVLSMITPALIVGSFQITEISRGFWPAIFDLDEPMRLLYILPVLVSLVISIIIMTALLEKPPFDPGHAETEIVMGWQTEVKGRSLALVNLATDISTWVVAGLIATLYLSPFEFAFPGNEVAILGKELDLLGILAHFVWFLVTTSLVVMSFSLIRTSQSRLRIDQVVQYFWRIFLPVTLLAVTLVVLIGALIGGL